MRVFPFIAATLFFAATTPASAALDLSRAQVEQLENGLTVIVLEERAAPVVSVHTAYRVGGRDDPAGRMGLAHFMEHMAFRQSKNFPGTRLVDSIYSVGGEWHGYTWIDQTNYFATVPKEYLDLLLRIESDRMARLVLADEDVNAETGAVIAEMNSYADDPSALLFDAVLASMFQVHPYRNNTIGYEADVKAIAHADVADFYARHYHPSNAAVAIVGDVDADAVIALAKKRFGKIRARAPATLPPASEPLRRGERRIVLKGGAADRQLFKIAYPAPPARSEDFAAFLVMQKLIGGGSGANFLQNEWGDAVESGARLDGIAEDLATWFIPTADPYVFTVSGSIAAADDTEKPEAAIQSALDALAAAPVTDEELYAARDAARRDLLFDIQTTEDAAHQLAFFDSIGALDRLPALDARLSEVSAADIRRVARAWLREDQRTVGWFMPGNEAAPEEQRFARLLPQAAPRIGKGAPQDATPAPIIAALANGVTAIVQVSPLSPTVSITVIAPGVFSGGGARENAPAPGYTSFNETGLSGELGPMAQRLVDALREAAPASTQPARNDPSARLSQLLDEAKSLGGSSIKSAHPIVIAVSGDIDPEETLGVLNDAFGAMPAAETPAAFMPPGEIESRVETVSGAKAQAALGYVVRAPGGDGADALAWRIALYILAHDYGGRLGAEAISRRGLLYYIGADYAADASTGWVTLSMDVDAEKLGAMRDLLKAELKKLVTTPPTAAEIDEAKRHLVGRRISAAQSNKEIADALAAEWLALGALREPDALKSALAGVSREDVVSILPAFTAGEILIVDVKTDPAQDAP
ncbi:MAG: insulinase family protein [Amphiplicatus sp.]